MDKATAKQMYEFVKQMQELNKDVEFRTLSRLEDDILAGKKFYASVPAVELQFPEGFYRNAFGKITNRDPNSMFEDYIEFEFGEIDKIKDIKTNNISEVNEELYTAEELALLEGKEEEKEPEVVEPEKKETSAFEYFEESEKKEEEKKEEKVVEEKKERKIVKAAKSLKCKASGLYNRIVNSIKYRLSKNAKIPTSRSEETEEEMVEREFYSRYNGTQLDALTTISNLLKKVENDDYLLDKLKNDVSGSIEEEIAKAPNMFADRLKDYTLIGELHKFAMKDSKYTDDVFKLIEEKAIELRHTSNFQMNRILQQVRYAGINENQMQFLLTKLGIEKELSNDNPTDKPEDKDKDKEENKKDTKEPNKLTVDEEIIAPIREVYEKSKKDLYDNLGEYEKAFVDDAKAEGLEPGDSEFITMINERAVNKNAIFDYLTSLEHLKAHYEDSILKASTMALYDKLDDIERTFIEDVNAEGLEATDNEFNMMLSERAVSKDKIRAYYNGVEAIYQNYKKSNKEVGEKVAKINQVREFFDKNFKEENVKVPSMEELRAQADELKHKFEGLTQYMRDANEKLKLDKEKQQQKNMKVITMNAETHDGISQMEGMEEEQLVSVGRSR